MAMMAPMATDEELALGHRIARNLQALIRAHGLNQGKLAERSGLSTSNVSNLVNGRKNPSFYSVAKAAMALNVDPLELAGFKPLQVPEPAPQPPDRLQELEGKFDALASQVEKLSKSLLEYVNEAHDTRRPPRATPRKVS